MKKFAQPIVLTAIVLVAAYGTARLWHVPGVNPDSNHAHADFAVWVDGQKLDFSADEYMSAPPDSDHEKTSFLTIPSAFAHDDGEHAALPGREYLHLHDGNGHVIHRHKPQLTLGDFFTSIGLQMTTDCLVLDAHQFSALDVGKVAEYHWTKKLCNDGTFHWNFVVNGHQRPTDPSFVFQDGDKILLSYSASDTVWQEEWKQMTDDACMYSKTCPWKGEPPTEGCIADPTVPCRE